MVDENDPRLLELLAQAQEGGGVELTPEQRFGGQARFLNDNSPILISPITGQPIVPIGAQGDFSELTSEELLERIENADRVLRESDRRMLGDSRDESLRNISGAPESFVQNQPLIAEIAQRESEVEDNTQGQALADALLKSGQQDNEKDATEESNPTENDRLLESFTEQSGVLDTLFGDIDLGFEESRFGDRSVLGEENIIRDMRYPIDIFEEESKLPNLISFEFFAKQSPKLNVADSLRNVSSAIEGIGQAATNIGRELGLLSGEPLGQLRNAGGNSLTGNLSARQAAAINNEYAQGRYITGSEVENDLGFGRGAGPLSNEFLNETTSQKQLEQVKDVRINKASERSKDRVFMYVPNSLSFSDTIDYDDGSQSALRTFYETGAGNTSTVKNALKLGVASAVSSRIGDISESIFGEVGKFDPYSSLKAQLGLATNPFNELAFKGMARKSFQFNFTFAPTSPKEAAMMQNIIQSFRFHSLPELSESTLQYFAPHEVEVKFYRTTLLDDQDKKVTDTFGRNNVSDSENDVRESTQVDRGFLGFGSKTKTVQQKLIENTEIPKIGRCFVTGVALNYSPQAKSSFFVNGVPTEVTMTLSLSQAITMNRQFVLKGF
tara:strand:+ start:75 stop:1907 length:1833 start_codon:yes stop_codon:yes gene_type:complete